MKVFLSTGYLALIVLLVLTNSCHHIVIVNSKAIIASRSIDIALNDSALIYGTVFFGESETVPMTSANVWIEGSSIKTISNNMGLFSLKIMPGIYSIKCLGEKYEEKFTAVLNNLSVSPNEKVEIRFFHGYIAQ
ncbi:MAG: hypothetical protein NTY07_20515 [Bacteroidia bacterium]|nr:hypothetical protein [Bacteroidia bacterium]